MKTIEEQQYSVLLKEIGGLLKSKNDAIMIKDYEIENLKSSLEAAESEIEKLSNYANTPTKEKIIMRDAFGEVVISNGKKYRLLIEDLETGAELVESFANHITDETVFALLKCFEIETGQIE